MADARLVHILPTILAVSTSPPTSAALRALLLDVLCGCAGDAVDRLRAVPPHASVADVLAIVVTRISCCSREPTSLDVRLIGQRLAMARRVLAQHLVLGTLEATVHTWIYRFVEIYGHGPGNVAIFTGLDLRPKQAIRAASSIARKGSLIHTGARGWLPTRRPQ